MRTLHQFIIAAGIAATAVSTAYADCGINLVIAPVEQGENVPDASADYLLTKLQQLVANSGDIAAGTGAGQFFITGKFNHVYTDVLAGPPTQTALHTELTLYIGDMNAQNVYASTTVELRGIGTSSQRAFINAMRNISPSHGDIRNFINDGKAKIISYYDSHYPQILEQARRASALHNYDEALWFLSTIPECCAGYDKALVLIKESFKGYIDIEGIRFLNAATAAWAKSPDEYGAGEAFGFLLQIDPESSAYAGAQKLAAEIKASVKSDRDFELRDKYHDAVDIEKARIDAAREIGTAYGRGQQPTTTNLMWLK